MPKVRSRSQLDQVSGAHAAPDWPSELAHDAWAGARAVRMRRTPASEREPTRRIGVFGSMSAGGEGRLRTGVAENVDVVSLSRLECSLQVGCYQEEPEMTPMTARYVGMLCAFAGLGLFIGCGGGISQRASGISDLGDAALAEAGPDSAATSDAGADAEGPCSPGAQECADGGAIQTCGADGGWSTPWPCASGTCSAGSCTGSTAGTLTPSCQGWGSTYSCGTQGESCCTSIEVPGGTYARTYTYDDAGAGPSAASNTAMISGFRLDKYEVTVWRFRQFVNALSNDGYLPAAGSGKHVHLNDGAGLSAVGASGTSFESGWLTSDSPQIHLPYDVRSDATFHTYTDAPGANDSKPVNCVSWYDAAAFCIWDGGFLSSEAEWEYAASGGSDLRRYPWGANDPGDPIKDGYAAYLCEDMFCTGVSNIPDVGSAPHGAGRWGHLDLAGSMKEWTLDWYGGYTEPCQDCTYVGASAGRSLRGGSFESGASALLSPLRESASPGLGGNSAERGIRCARTP
jgi:sulfatase modifying factor 1